MMANKGERCLFCGIKFNNRALNSARKIRTCKGNYCSDCIECLLLEGKLTAMDLEVSSMDDFIYKSSTEYFYNKSDYEGDNIL